MIDVVFVAPGNNNVIYQDLSKRYTTVEPPTWALLLAESCRSRKLTPAIIDINAEGLNDNQVLERINTLDPRLVVFVVYGQNVNAGTVSMSGAVATANHLKSNGLSKKIAFLGSYPQALPKKCLNDEPSIDFVFTNEGVYSLWNILEEEGEIDNELLCRIDGIAYRNPVGEVVINTASPVVPQSRMDYDLPGYAWDLLPYDKKPLDLYRAPMWHAEYREDNRSPYAAIQTSLGCQFKCSFCMINILNRSDDAEVGVASNYSGMRFWSPEFIIKEFDKLNALGVKTIKITDEMFLLNRKYYEPLLKLLSERSYSKELMMWAYSRIDTVRDPKTLSLLRSAGIRWLALGIESADKTVRLEVSKGKFEDVDIEQVVKQVHEAGIHIMGNYIFGLPGDTKESMRATLDLSKELCTLGWNAYGAMALPGSELYYNAIQRGDKLPETYEEYSFYGYNTLPLSNGILSSAEVLDFRDKAFVEYHSNPKYLDRIEEQFGIEARKNISRMLDVKLRRKLLDE
jgi:anaerobic magnesium-protoporphyrin IX monomethyl ester cyclase